ncbi:glycoside hydrolase superfamily [Hyaloraphidium curvatum]|nr:glycoside hydrolase superfamily [Hyaloraphidium curvatum]
MATRFRGRSGNVLGLIGLAAAVLLSAADAAPFPPADFAFGCATSAFQIEGATSADGRGRSIWDDFVSAGHIQDGSDGETVAQHYYRWAEDARLFRELGANTYSLTISWTRIFPTGTGTVNEPGLNFYVNLIRELRKNGLRVQATVYHWELPSALQAHGGWLNRSAVIEPFARYARTLFSELTKEGVSAWVTMNEPRTFCSGGYMWGDSPPLRCSDRSLCKEGDSLTEPYVCGHHALLAHAAAVKIWRREFAAQFPNVRIGIVLDGEFNEPLTNSAADAEAARRQLVFNIGWFANPIFLGDYPQEMRQTMGSDLPSFTSDEIADIKGSSDFYAWDYYTSSYAYDTLKGADCTKANGWYPSCSGSTVTARNGSLIGPATGHPFFFAYAPGLRKGLRYLRDTYSPPYFLVTENGYAGVNESSLPIEQRLKDAARIEFLRSHLQALREAVEIDNVDVRGFYAWSCYDNLEWKLGLSVRFGLVHVDFDNNSTRTFKDSAYFFCNTSRDLTGHTLACQQPGPLVTVTLPFSTTALGTPASTRTPPPTASTTAPSATTVLGTAASTRTPSPTASTTASTAFRSTAGASTSRPSTGSRSVPLPLLVTMIGTATLVYGFCIVNRP